MTPEMIESMRITAQEQAEAVCAIIKKEWDEISLGDEPAPVTLKVEYDGHEGLSRIAGVALVGVHVEAIKLNDRLHSFLRIALNSDPDRHANKLISYVVALAGHGAWCIGDGARGEVVIDMNTGNIRTLAHEARGVEYVLHASNRDDLFGDEPVVERSGPALG